MKRMIASAAFIAALAAMAPGVAEAAKIDTNDRLRISSDDGSFSLRLSARVHADVNFYDSDTKALTSGAFIRRARIGVSGNLHEWGYEVTFDNAGDAPDLKDARLTRRAGPGTLAIGQFKVFEGLEQLTSSNDITFIERSHVGNTVAGRKIGLGYNGTAGMVGYAGTVYNLREAAEGGTRAINDGIGVAARAYVAPIKERDRALHFGVSYALENTDNAGARGRVRPAGRANDYRDGDAFRFVTFDRRGERAEIDRLNLEAAAVFGPFSAQAEYLIGNADTDTRAKDDFTVWYAQASYMLTGETRSYDFGRGRMRAPKPQSEWGAVELAARYQYAERDNVPNAELTTIDLGVNYYASANVRFMLNYSMVDNKLIDDKPNLVSMRAQWAF